MQAQNEVKCAQLMHYLYFDSDITVWHYSIPSVYPFTSLHKHHTGSTRQHSLQRPNEQLNGYLYTCQYLLTL
jgi:hypothetical protein